MGNSYHGRRRGSRSPKSRCTGAGSCLIRSCPEGSRSSVDGVANLAVAVVIVATLNVALALEGGGHGDRGGHREYSQEGKSDGRLREMVSLEYTSVNTRMGVYVWTYGGMFVSLC